MPKNLYITADYFHDAHCSSRIHPVGHWTFEDGEQLRDLTGNVGDIKLRNAVVKNGQLDLGVDKWAVADGYNGSTILEKTLVSWVSIDDITVQKGSVLSIDKISIDQFDAIVFGERMRLIIGWLAVLVLSALLILCLVLKKQRKM